jgi:hypothetical protein
MSERSEGFTAIRNSNLALISSKIRNKSGKIQYANSFWGQLCQLEAHGGNGDEVAVAPARFKVRFGVDRNL